MNQSLEERVREQIRAEGPREYPSTNYNTAEDYVDAQLRIMNHAELLERISVELTCILNQRP